MAIMVLLLAGVVGVLVGPGVGGHDLLEEAGHAVLTPP